jgi:hypothetical protein
MIWVCFSRSGIGSMTDLLAKETFTRFFFIDKVMEFRHGTGGDTAKEARFWHFSAPRQRSHASSG